jgi:hypothetical protein
MTRSWLSFLTTVFFLLLSGAIAGVILAVLGLALSSAIQSLQNSDAEGILGLLAELFFLLMDVLAVSVVAAPGGLWIGLITGAAIGLAYGVIYFFLPQLLAQRWLLALIFAIAGAIAAALSLPPLLAEYQVAAILCGALFGLLASLPLRKQPISATPV